MLRGLGDHIRKEMTTTGKRMESPKASSLIQRSFMPFFFFFFLNDCVGKSTFPKVIVKLPEGSFVTYIPCRREHLQTKHYFMLK